MDKDKSYGLAIAKCICVDLGNCKLNEGNTKENKRVDICGESVPQWLDNKHIECLVYSEIRDKINYYWIELNIQPYRGSRMCRYLITINLRSDEIFVQ